VSEKASETTEVIPAPAASAQAAAHTPSPWTIDQEWLPPEYPDWRSIRLGKNYLSVSGHIGEANARLICAAPDLLALAKQYASECAGCSGRGFTYGDDGVSGRGPDDVEPTRYPCEDCDDIRAAIAKAEGRGNG